MRILTLLAGAALVALSPAALAQGKGHGHGGGGDSAGERGGGKDRGGGKSRGGQGGPGEQRGSGFERRAQGPGQGQGPDRQGGGADRGKGRSDVARGPDRPDRGNTRGPRQEVRAEQRGSDRGGPDFRDKDVKGRDVDRGHGPGNVERVAFASGGRERRVRVYEGGRYRWNGNAVSGWCPPGLAKKGNGCMPPGQARKLIGPAGFYRYSPWYDDAVRYDWRYWNGYGYRMDPLTGLVAASLPLLGGALYLGNPWPVDYPYYDPDPYYDRYYGYSGYDYDYRYANDTLFAVDPTTAAIVAIAALLTGDDWAIGRRMPLGYSIYNVPPPYRARYYDRPDAWYRYSDGYVYRVEPRTMIVRETIVLL